MVLRNNKGEYLLQWKKQGNMNNIGKIDRKELATRFDSVFISDILDMLRRHYPNECWIAEAC